MKLSILTAGAVLASAVSMNAHAQTCAPQPSCADLGYTLSSTADCLGTPLKCPFDKNKFNCVQQSATAGDIRKAGYTKDTSVDYQPGAGLSKRKIYPGSWSYIDNASGLIFQGGMVNITSSEPIVNFRKPFTNPPLTLIVSPYEQPTVNDNNYVAMPINVTTTSFQIRYFDTDRDDKSRQGPVSWFAVGY